MSWLIALICIALLVLFITTAIEQLKGGKDAGRTKKRNHQA